MNISAKASRQLLSILESSPGMKGLRVFIQGGGCSGFEYNFELANKPDQDDSVFYHSFEERDFFLCVDELSASLLDEALLDYHADLKGARFIVKNPNVSGQCSCGSSFSLN